MKRSVSFGRATVLSFLLVGPVVSTLAGCTDCSQAANRDACEESIFYEGSRAPTTGGLSGNLDGEGGESPSSGGASDGGPSGGAPPSGTESTTTYAWGTEDSETAIDPGEWLVDSSLGVHSGDTALHPPEFDAGDPFAFSFDCGGTEHTQLTFYMVHDGGGVELELQVSGEDEPRVIPQATPCCGWQKQIIDVEPGLHTYTFTAFSAAASPPRVLIDSITCLSSDPRDAENGYVEFDEGFIPLEVDGEWHTDNLLGVHQGEAAQHPPAFEAGDEYTFWLECAGEDHTQLTFQLVHDGGGVQLDLQVSGEDEPRVISQATPCCGWQKQVIDVEQGPHTYTFTAFSAADSPPRVLIDFIACLSGDPSPAENGYVDLDDGFIPMEIEGQWHVDNLLGVHQGEAALHPPTFEAEGEETYTFSLECSAEDHDELRFMLVHDGGGVELGLQVSGEQEPRVISQATPCCGWQQQVYAAIGDPGPRTYTFTATSPAESPPRVLMDSFICD